jgi:ferredoxin
MKPLIPQNPKLTVLPANLCAEVAPGDSLIRAGQKAGVDMEAGCFSCSCGACVVEVRSGIENLSAPSSEELEILDGLSKDPDHFRLACSTKILSGQVTICQL